MSRKNLFEGLTDPKLTAVNSADPATPIVQRPRVASFAGKGALGAVTRSIDELAAQASEAKELEARLVSGQVIVELDPATIDSSFIPDRMSQDDDAYRALRDSIAESGQDSPILVRPHPAAQGRYQVAFGHRRLRVAQELARPVRAVVRELTDRDLILAQGQENSARANLSFIERARFAHKLETAGYDRDTIMQSLSVDKTTLSRLISVAARIPSNVIDAIGSAHGTGRDRWSELATLFHEGKSVPDLPGLLASEVFRNSGSDFRFQQVVAAFSDTEQDAPSAATQEEGRTGRPSRYWSHTDGTRVMKITATDRAVVLSIDSRSVPGFGEYLLGEMESLFTAFISQKSTPEPARTKPIGAEKKNS